MLFDLGDINIQTKGQKLKLDCTKLSIIVFFSSKSIKLLYILFYKNKFYKNIRLRFVQILERRGPKYPIFEFSWKKQKRHFFTLPKTSIHEKNQKIPMRCFGENLTHRNDRQTERETKNFQAFKFKVNLFKWIYNEYSWVDKIVK